MFACFVPGTRRLAASARHRRLLRLRVRIKAATYIVAMTSSIIDPGYRKRAIAIEKVDPRIERRCHKIVRRNTSESVTFAQVAARRVFGSSRWRFRRPETADRQPAGTPQVH